MIKGLLQFLKPLVLLATIATILLFTDRHNREGVRNASDQTKTDKVKIAFVGFSNSSPVEDTERGIRDVIDEAGLTNRIILDVYNAQNDMSIVASIVDNVKAKEYDIIMPVCTPTSQAVKHQFNETPIVFSLVADPVFAGLGSSFEEHPPNISGISVMADFARMVELIKEIIPNCKRIGTLFNPAEANSVASKEHLSKVAQNLGLELIAIPISNPGEISDATLALLSKDIEAICQIADNITASSYSGILSEVNKTNMPYFSFMTRQTVDGGLLSVSRDYYQNGRDAMRITERIMNGEDLANIPFSVVKKTEVVLNESTLQRIDLTISPSTLSKINRTVQ